MSRVGRAVVAAAAVAALAGTAVTALNLRYLRRTEPPGHPCSLEDRISVLIPMRNEITNVDACLRAVLADPAADQIVILDDGSSDGTGRRVQQLTARDPRVQLITAADTSPPVGWLGKPWACQRLADAADGSVLAFLDADVILEPGGLARSVAGLRAGKWDLYCPYPRQLADGWLPRIVQPLLQWSWLTFLPLAVADATQWPSMAVGNGQLLLVDAVAYRREGGHRTVAGQVLEDVELARAFRTSGLRTAVTDGSTVASCRMYRGGNDLVRGYTKSLWAAFGPLPAAATTLAGLAVLYLVPPVALVVGRGRTRGWALAGTAAAATGRAIVAARVGGRVCPDALAHPVSISALIYLTARSFQLRRTGQLSWKGRPVEAQAGSWPSTAQLAGEQRPTAGFRIRSATTHSPIGRTQH